MNGPNPLNIIQNMLSGPLVMHQARLQSYLTTMFLVDRSQRMASPGGLRADSCDDGEWTTDTARIVNGVAIIPIRGVLVTRSSPWDFWYGCVGYDAIRAWYASALNDARVHTILTLLETPGGSASGVFEFSRWLKAQRPRKRLLCIMDRYSFSGGMAISSAHEVAFIPPDSSVGSVGVITGHTCIAGMMAKWGLEYTPIFAGDKKADGIQELPLSEGARADIQAEVDTVYRLFTALIAENLGITQEAVVATQAGCFMGQQAVDAGFATEVATIDQVYDALGIQTEEN